MAIFKIVPDTPKRSIPQMLWSWPVVGSVLLLVLGGALSFMTSPHTLVADGFFVVAAVLFLAKFLTWEEANQGNRPRRILVSAIVFISTLVISATAIVGNHYLHRPIKTVEVLINPDPISQP